MSQAAARPDVAGKSQMPRNLSNSAKWQRNLLVALGNATNLMSALDGVMTVLGNRQAHLEGYYLQRDSADQLSQCLSYPPGSGPPSELLAAPMRRLADIACGQGTAISAVLPGGSDGWIAVPVVQRRRPPDVLLLSVGDTVPAKLNNEWLLLAELTSAHLSLWHIQRQSAQLEQQSEIQLLALDLEKIGESDNQDDITQQLAELLRNRLGCQRVAVGLTQSSDRIKLEAISGAEHFDPAAELAQQLDAFLNEAVEQSSPGYFHSDCSAVKSPAASLLLDSGSANYIGKLAVSNAQGEILGAIACLSDQPQPAMQRIIAKLTAAHLQLASCFTDAQSQKQSALRTWTLGKWPRLEKPYRWWCIGAVALLLLFGLMIPVPHKMACDAILRPVVRRFIAAPYDGTLKGAEVELGDVVQAGQLLARMNDHEIQWELSALNAELQRAAKQRDVAQATQEFAAAQVARLEMERLELKRELLQNRLDNLEIRSPIDGLVVAGDLQRAIGAPLKIGQTLFEIAPLSRMTLELSIPESEISYVSTEMPVEIKLQAYPRDTLTGNISRIQLQAELRDRQNVFIAELPLDNRDDRLRPGMKGNAWVVGRWHPLGWNLFHSAWNAFCLKLGW